MCRGGLRLGLRPDYLVLVGTQFDKLATMCLLVLSLGTMYQFLVSIGQAMPMFFMVLLATIVVGATPGPECICKCQS